MGEIGVKDLKHQLSAILRRVREDKETIIITHHGHPVAKIIPVEDPDVLWAELDQLALEVDRKWKSGVSAAEAVSNQRR